MFLLGKNIGKRKYFMPEKNKMVRTWNLYNILSVRVHEREHLGGHVRHPTSTQS